METEPRPPQPSKPGIRQAISTDMRDLITLFLKHDVQFALCGGFAVSYYGFIRTTMDLDLLVYPSLENAERIMLALNEFGFGSAGIDKAAFCKRGTAITLGVQPNQIDLLTSMSSEDEKSVFSEIDTADIWGMRIPIVGKRALLRAKRESTRPRDRIDYDELINCES